MHGFQLKRCRTSHAAPSLPGVSLLARTRPARCPLDACAFRGHPAERPRRPCIRGHPTELSPHTYFQGDLPRWAAPCIHACRSGLTCRPSESPSLMPASMHSGTTCKRVPAFGLRSECRCRATPTSNLCTTWSRYFAPSSSGSSSTRSSIRLWYQRADFLRRRVRCSSSSMRTRPYRFLKAFMGLTLSVNAQSI